MSIAEFLSMILRAVLVVMTIGFIAIGIGASIGYLRLWLFMRDEQQRQRWDR